MNYRALIGQYVAAQNPWMSKRRRFPWLEVCAIVAAFGALIGIAWFVCNIVVVGP